MLYNLTCIHSKRRWSVNPNTYPNQLWQFIARIPPSSARYVSREKMTCCTNQILIFAKTFHMYNIVMIKQRSDIHYIWVLSILLSLSLLLLLLVVWLEVLLICEVSHTISITLVNASSWVLQQLLMSLMISIW